MKQLENEYLVSYRYYFKFLWSVVFSLIVLSTTYGQATTIKTFETDTTSVLRNPCMG